MRRRWLLLGAGIGLVAAAAATAQQRDPPIPRLGALPPLEEIFTRRHAGPFRVHLRDIRATAGSRTVILPELEIAGDVPASRATREPVHLTLVRLTRPVLLVRPGSGEPGHDVLAGLGVPPMRVDRVVITGGSIRALPGAGPRDAPDRWRAEGVNVELRDVAVEPGGDAAGHVVAGAFGGAVEGRPFRVDSLTGSARLRAGVLAFQGRAALGASRLALAGELGAAGAQRLDVAADTVAFADLRPFVESLPAEGGARGSFRVMRRGEDWALEVPGLRAGLGASSLLVSGKLARSAAAGWSGALLLETPAFHPEDLELEDPDRRVWSGRAMLEGAGAGLRLDAEAAGATAGRAVTLLTARGLLHPGAITEVALRLTASLPRTGTEPLELAGDVTGSVATAGAGALALDVRLESLPLEGLAGTHGPPLPNGTVAVAGRITGPLRRPVAEVHAALRLADHPGAAVDARGTLVLAGDGAVDVRVDAGALPLALLPLPAAVTDVGGTAAGAFRVGGTLAHPAVEGTLVLSDGALTVPSTGTEVHGVGGRVAVRAGVATLQGLEGVVGGGRAALTGEVRFTGERTMDVAFQLERGWVVDTDSAALLADANVTAAGPWGSPTLGGRVVLLEGWVHEDVLVREPALDPADPPYAAYVERVPWIAGSRLRRAPGLPAVDAVDAVDTVASAAAPLFAGAVEVEILPGVAMVDEDSELRGHGVLTLTGARSSVDVAGLFRVRSGFYANYGRIFQVHGGAFLFPGTGLAPLITLRAGLEVDAPLGSGLGEPLRPFHGRFPPLAFFAQGSAAGRVEAVSRLALLPEDPVRLARLLLTGVEAGAMEGRRYDRFWLPGDGAGLLGERGTHHAVTLLWNYVANEAYDFLPPRRGWMEAGVVTVGAGFPAWLTAAPLLRAGIVLGEGEIVVTQAVARGAPGVRVRWRRDGFTLSAFHEPRFRPVASPGFPGWEEQRRTGVGLHWSSWSGGG